MRALVLREHGEGGLRLETDFPDPVAGEGDVVLRVRATSLNYHDVFTRRGMPGIRIAMPAIMGLDVAGEIAALGSGVTGWRLGDRVLGDPINRVEGGLTGETVHGGLAEYCRLRAHQLVTIPDGVSFVEAAALPCAYGTARRMMHTNGHVAAGEKVLILGASGGVGVCCVQLAKAAGATVIAATGSEDKAARLRALGADHTINYRENPEWGKTVRSLTGGRGVDHVIEVGGPGTLPQSITACRIGGHIALIGVLTGRAGPVPTAALMARQQRLQGLIVGSRQDQRDMTRALEVTGIKPVIDSTFELAKLGDAFRHEAAGAHFGKICVSI